MFFEFFSSKYCHSDGLIGSGLDTTSQHDIIFTVKILVGEKWTKKTQKTMKRMCKQKTNKNSRCKCTNWHQKEEMKNEAEEGTGRSGRQSERKDCSRREWSTVNTRIGCLLFSMQKISFTCSLGKEFLTYELNKKREGCNEKEAMKAQREVRKYAPHTLEFWTKRYSARASCSTRLRKLNQIMHK